MATRIKDGWNWGRKRVMPTGGKMFPCIKLALCSVGLVALLTQVACTPVGDADGAMRANRDKLRDLLRDSSSRLKVHVRELSRTSSLAGSPTAMRHVEYVENFWRDLGFRVSRRSYEVPISYFEQQGESRRVNSSRSEAIEQPSVSVCFAEDCRALELDKPLTREDRDIEGLSRAFYAYSRPLSGHFGLLQPEDFAEYMSVENLTALLEGNLVLVRPNETALLELLMQVATRTTNNTGFLLVHAPPGNDEDGSGDPDAAQPQQPAYPEGPGSPDTAVTFHVGGPEDTVGDPTTPGYPSRWYASRQEPGGKAGWKSALNVTVVPISVADAEVLASAFASDSGTERPHLRVHWPLQFGYREVYDSCAEILGDQEPDRVVLIGSHRDAWFGGAVDPHTGMATLLETGRALAELRDKTGWRPRRTILMCAWDAEELGLMGSVEWVEEEFMRIGSRLVAYVNTDTDVIGDWKMLVQSSDQLTDIINQILLESADTSSEDGSPLHFFYKLDDSSDYFSFTRALGVPACDFSYTLTLYDLYHTRYETPRLYEMLDPTGKAHPRLAQSVASLVYTMADSPLLPLNMSAFANGLRWRLYDGFFAAADNGTGGDLWGEGEDEFDAVRQRLQAVALSALENATRALHRFEEEKKLVDESAGQLRLRMLNDKMMLVQKAFTHHCVLRCNGDSVNLLNGLPRNLPAEKVAQAIILGLNSVAKLLTDSFTDDY
uniref:Peptidase_M28 domain-containing protein n=1 Tax=Macrostomum lignano TaxID=282301 RepID=A0A1I8IB63_9PLAT